MDLQTDIADFQADAARLLMYAQHAGAQYTRGDIAGAAMTIALTHYDTAYLNDRREKLVELIEQRHGVTPRDAIRLMFAGQTPGTT